MELVIKINKKTITKFIAFCLLLFCVYIFFFNQTFGYPTRQPWVKPIIQIVYLTTSVYRISPELSALINCVLMVIGWAIYALISTFAVQKLFCKGTKMDYWVAIDTVFAATLLFVVQFVGQGNGILEVNLLDDRFFWIPAVLVSMGVLAWLFKKAAGGTVNASRKCGVTLTLLVVYAICVSASTAIPFINTARNDILIGNEINFSSFSMFWGIIGIALSLLVYYKVLKAQPMKPLPATA